MDKLALIEKSLWLGVTQKADNQVVIERDWVQLTTPLAPTAFLNGIYRCELSEDVIEERILKTLEHYKQLKLPFRWRVGPGSRPQNLKSLLIKNGLVLKETLFGLFADPKVLTVPTNPEVSIRALSPETLEDWLSVQVSAWSVPPQGIAYLRKNQEQAFAAGDTMYLNFIAYLRDKPVASAGLRFYSEYGYLMGAAVNPDCRGQGIYQTMVAHRMNLIRERGIPALIHCLEGTSAPICLRLGFEKVCEIQSFESSHAAGV